MTFSAPAVWHSLWLLNLTCNAGLDPPLRGNGFDAIRNDGILGLLTVLSHLALPLTAAFLATFGLFVLMFRWANRRRLARGALDSEKGFRKWSVSVLHELTGMRPFVYFMVAWTFCVILIVDSVYGYMGLGTLMGWSFGIRDYPLMMALLFVSSLFVLVAGIVVNTAFNLASRRDLDVAMSDWVQRDEAFEDNTMAKEEKAVQPRQWIVAIAGLSVRNWAFMGAVIVLLAVAASAALAPTLVTEPWNLWYLEPDAYVYSETLYGARPAIVIAAALVVGAVSIGIAVGMASFYFPSADAFPKILKDLFDFVLTALARTYVIIPITLIGIAWMLTAQTHLSTIPLLLVALYSWAWIMTCRPIRSMARTAGPRVRFGRALPGILAESLSIAKFVVPIAFLIEMLLSSNYLNFGPGSRADFTWYNLFEQIYALGGFLYGDWYLVYIPIAAIVLVCASLFVVLDRTEHILRTSQVYPERRLAVVDEEATPGS
jgi:ABC-type dipeptide/oligopeptide/nickel transport system permease subunit